VAPTGLNPCYRLERSERTVSSIFEPYRIVTTSWANAFGRLWLALNICGSGAAQTRTKMVALAACQPDPRLSTCRTELIESKKDQSSFLRLEHGAFESSPSDGGARHPSLNYLCEPVGRTGRPGHPYVPDQLSRSDPRLLIDAVVLLEECRRAGFAKHWVRASDLHLMSSSAVPRDGPGCDLLDRGPYTLRTTGAVSTVEAALAPRATLTGWASARRSR
jgi:hypothetical protein